MRKEFKIIIAVFAATAVLALFIYIFNIFARPSSMLSYLPEPPELKQYVLVEAAERSFPVRLSAFLTEGPFAEMHRGTSRNALLSLAQTAREVAVLIVNEDLAYAEVYAVYRLSAKAAATLRKGAVPEEWLELLPSSRIEIEKKGSGKIWSPDIGEPIYYYLDKDKAILAADQKPFDELLELRSAKGKKKHVWWQEKKWPGHIEMGDGAALLNGASPVKLQFAWRSLPRPQAAGLSGEAKWTIGGLKAEHKAFLLRLLKPVEWQITECVLPASPIMVTGLNIPKLKSSPENWPTPLSTVAKLAVSLGISKNSVRELMSGKTIFSLGGKNKLLWLTLPGFMIEFSGSRSLTRALIESFWSNFFHGSEPNRLDGWDYGGSISMPFSVLGVGRGNTALLGLVSAASLRDGAWLATYLQEREKAIGWLVADLSKLGDSLSDMTRMMSLLAFEDGEGGGYVSGDSDDGEEVIDTPFRSGELDQGIADSFSGLLKNLGMISVVWERPESGRLSWYNK